MKRYTFNVDATSVAGSQTYYVDAESEDEARVIVEGGGGEFVCEQLEVQDLGTFELADVEDIPVELEATRATPADPVGEVYEHQDGSFRMGVHWYVTPPAAGTKLYVSATPADHISQARDAWVAIGARVPAEPGFYLAMMVEENSFGYSTTEPVLVEFDDYTTHPKQFVVNDSWTNGPEDCTTEMTHWMPLPAPPEKPAGDVSDI